VAIVNVLACWFGSHTLNGARSLNPWEDRVVVRARGLVGDYAYYVSFGRGAIALLIVALAITTVLMFASIAPERGRPK
jgi:hypothetical protein